MSGRVGNIFRSADPEIVCPAAERQHMLASSLYVKEAWRVEEKMRAMAALLTCKACCCQGVSMI